MKTLTLLLLLFLQDHSILVPKTITLSDYTDYSAILIWNLADSPTNTPTINTDYKIGDKCPICKGTGTYVSGDGIVRKPCDDCGRDGVLDKGDPLLTSLSPEKDCENCNEEEINTEGTREDKTAATEENSEEPTEEITEGYAIEPSKESTENSINDWEKKVPPLSTPENAQVETKEVWHFTYRGTPYYYYPDYDCFVSLSNTVYKITLPQEEWVKSGSINVCTYDSNGRELTCTNCPVSKVNVPTTLLNYKPLERPTRLPQRTSDSSAPDTYASPQDVVDRILAYLKPLPHEVFLDVGSGDGRVAISAAKKYGCLAIGIESDPERVALARENAEAAGVSDRVRFLEGDFTQIDWPRADVGYVYLFPEDLGPIRERLLSLDRFASFAHQVPKTPMYSLFNREAFYWDYDNVFTWYSGSTYKGRHCSRANCSMCATIQAGLDEQRSYR